MIINYDYTELISFLKKDMERGDIRATDTVWVQRQQEPIFTGYRPIIDYYTDAERPGDMALESMLAGNCLIEMEGWNSIDNVLEQ